MNNRDKTLEDAEDPIPEVVRQMLVVMQLRMGKVAVPSSARKNP